MTIIETRHVTRFGRQFTLVMTEGRVNDVAVYEAKGHVEAQDAATQGCKYTERQAGLVRFTIPTGKHYRL